jgi:hypothetical protein
VLVLAASAVAYLHTDAGGEFLRRRIAARASERVTTSITIERVAFSLRAGVTIEGLAVRDVEGQDAITLRRIVVVPRYRELPRGIVAFESLRADGAAVHVRAKDDGTSNLTGLVRPKEDPRESKSKPRKAPHVRVEDLAIEGASLTVSREGGDRTSVSGVALRGRVDANLATRDIDARLALSVDTVEVRRQHLELSIADVRLPVSAALRASGGANGGADGADDHDGAQASAGEIAAGPLDAKLTLKRAGIEPYETRVSLPEVKGSLTPARLVVVGEAFEGIGLAIAAFRVEAARGGAAGETELDAVALERVTVRARELEKLAGRPVLASDVALTVQAAGPKDARRVNLQATAGGAVLEAEATLDTRDASAVSYRAKVDVRNVVAGALLASPNVPDVAVTELRLTADGKGTRVDTARSEATIAARGVRVRQTNIDRIDARATLANGRLHLTSLSAESLGQRADFEARYTFATRELDAELRLHPNLQTLRARWRETGRAGPPPKALASLEFVGPLAVRARGNVDGQLTLTTAPVRARVRGQPLVVTFAGTLDREDGRPTGGTFALDAALEGRDGTFTRPGVARRLRMRGALHDGLLDADGALEANDGTRLVTWTARGFGVRTGAPRVRPGSLHVTAEEMPLAAFSPFLRAEARERLPPDAKVSLRIAIDEGAKATRAEAHVVARQGEALALDVRASAALDGPMREAGTAPLRWKLDVDQPETPLEALPLATRLHGRVALKAHAHGTRSDVLGDVTLTARGVMTASDGGREPLREPVDATLRVTLADDTTSLALTGDIPGFRFVEAEARARRGGKGLLAALRGGRFDVRETELEGELRLPSAPVASWARLVPRAEGAKGAAGLTVGFRGTANAPEVSALATYDGYRTLDGRTAAFRLEVAGTPEVARATASLRDEARLSLRFSPRQLLGARARSRTERSTVDVHGALVVEDAPLASLLPDLPILEELRLRGEVASRLEADATIALEGDQRELAQLELRGTLGVSGGALALPGTARRIHGITLKAHGDADRLVLERLEARESDRDEPNRTLAVEGAFHVRERELRARAVAHRVLVSGGNFGALDAPRAALSGDVDIRAALAGPVRRVEVDVNALDVESADRQPRATHQEVTSLGDVLELEPGLEVGKLPVPRDRLAPRATETSTPRAGEKTLDLLVHIPKPVRVEQRPLELWFRGDVHVERFGEARVASGTLVCTGGSLLVGGRPHRLVSGDVKLVDAGPMLDLTFRYAPHPAALRDVATGGEQASDSPSDDPAHTEARSAWVFAHVRGVLGRTKTTFSGVSATLFDALAIENIGRVRVHSRPDRPMSETAQLPQTLQIRQSAFMSANLPHLAFLHRIDAHADPTASRFAYGRFESLEAERYSVDGRRRLRTTVRPRTLGQSDGELQADWLFRNTPRVVSGVGVLAGTRGGGGPVVFWEWSSAD